MAYENRTQLDRSPCNSPMNYREIVTYFGQPQRGGFGVSVRYNNDDYWCRSVYFKFIYLDLCISMYFYIFIYFYIEDLLPFLGLWDLSMGDKQFRYIFHDFSLVIYPCKSQTFLYLFKLQLKVKKHDLDGQYFWGFYLHAFTSLGSALFTLFLLSISVFAFSSFVRLGFV